jgi:glucose/arabinose dehydrogenase
MLPERFFWPALGLVGLLVLGIPDARSAAVGLDYQQQILSVPEGQQEVRIPTGYRLELLTTDLKGPRLLTFADNGDLFAGSQSGDVYRLPAPYSRPEVLVHLGDYPHSVALRGQEILIAQTDGLYLAPYRAGQTALSRKEVRRWLALPAGGGHSSRTVRIGPEGKVYLSLGLSGNCSDEYLGPAYPFQKQRGGILVVDEDPTGAPRWETHASGLRNPVGFDWHPTTRQLYASNNGPDHQGFDLPPEYFTRVEPGSFHGMPWFQYNGAQIRRDDCIARDPPRPQEEVVIPEATFPARSAPMGVAFVPVGAMDARFHGDALVALHGSWATRPAGGAFGDAASRRPPKIVAVRFEEGKAQRVDDLITGFQLPDGTRWARPVGVAIGPDGALYFTSDAGIHGLFRLRRAE